MSASKSEVVRSTPLAAGASSNAVHDIRIAIERHGSDAVREAVEQLIPTRRGRPKVDDWSILRRLLDSDVRQVISGGSPFKTANHAIARAFADVSPGQSRSSTIRRIERKLKDKDARRFFVYLSAWYECRSSGPFAVALLALEELSSIHPKGPWSEMLKTAERAVSAYSIKKGKPAEALSLLSIEEASRIVLHTGLLARKR